MKFDLTWPEIRLIVVCMNNEVFHVKDVLRKKPLRFNFRKTKLDPELREDKRDWIKRIEIVRRKINKQLKAQHEQAKRERREFGPYWKIPLLDRKS